MQKSIETIRQLRHTALKLLAGLSLEQLNKVPSGFSNNIIWNAGHLIAAQQGICYRRAGQELRITADFFDRYKPDSKPERPVTQEEAEEIKELLISTIDQLSADCESGLLNHYTPWVSRYGVPIENVEKAVAFLPFHEGYHMGYISALKKAIFNETGV